MANYTEEETLLIISLYREYCQTKKNTYKLRPEDKQVLLKHLKDHYKDFDSYNHAGYVFYKRFPLPFVLPRQTSVEMRRSMSGEGLDSNASEILTHIEERIQSEMLIDIWAGEIPDVCIIFASIIEAGLGAKVLPRVKVDGDIQIDATVSLNAKAILKKRKEDKLNEMRKTFGQDNQKP